MKLLAPVLLLLPALATAVWRHGHWPDSNAIYRQGDYHDNDGGGATRYQYREQAYEGAAGRAAAEVAYGSGSGSGSGSASGSAYRRHKHMRHYKAVGCNVRLRPIESLMGVGATQCAECLTATAIAGSNKSYSKHGSYYSSVGAYAKTNCRDVCNDIPRVRAINPLTGFGGVARALAALWDSNYRLVSHIYHTNPGERVLRTAAQLQTQNALLEWEHLLPGCILDRRMPVLWYVWVFRLQSFDEVLGVA